MRNDNTVMMSQMTASDTRIGTNKNAPGTPQSQVQKINKTKLTTEN